MVPVGRNIHREITSQKYITKLETILGGYSVRTYINTTIITLFLFLIAGCDGGTGIEKAESDGFAKDQQLPFAMIGAIDGYSGTWEGESVKLYTYESSEKVSRAFFESSLSDDKQVCINQNIVMIAPKGNSKACKALQNL